MRATVIRHTHLLEVNVIGKLHVLGVDLKNLETAGGVRDSNINLAVETTEASKGRVNRVGSVCGSHDHNVGPSLHAVHEGK